MPFMDGTFKSRFAYRGNDVLTGSDGYAFGAPVGRFKPNPFGLYDMHGNAAEWCEDWGDENYYGKSPPEDPKGAPSGSSRVVRGGSWSHDAAVCRAASRNAGTPSSCSSNVGFRVVRVSE